MKVWEPHVLASVCHPKFKNMDFIEDEEKRKWTSAVEYEMPPTEGHDVEIPKDKTSLVEKYVCKLLSNQECGKAFQHGA